MSHVWEFTNQRKLSRKEFISYFERKVFKTIRKYQMLPTNKILRLKRSTDLNTTILKKILEKKFQVQYSNKPNISADNLSQAAEDTFKKILKGNFKQSKKINQPLYELSDKEIELYAKLTNTKGTKRKQDKKIQKLFNKFLKKNQDLELNVVKAMGQLN